MRQVRGVAGKLGGAPLGSGDHLREKPKFEISPWLWDGPREMLKFDMSIPPPPPFGQVLATPLWVYSRHSRINNMNQRLKETDSQRG